MLKFSDLKQDTYLMVFAGQETGCCLTGCLWVKVAVKLSAVVVDSLNDSTWVVVSASKITVVVDLRILASCS